LELSARMAELVDALDSKSSDSNIVWVRFPLRVHYQKKTAKKQKLKSLIIQEVGLLFCLYIFS
jgi:hypothetical protein